MAETNSSDIATQEPEKRGFWNFFSSIGYAVWDGFSGVFSGFWNVIKDLVTLKPKSLPNDAVYIARATSSTTTSVASGLFESVTQFHNPKDLSDYSRLYRGDDLKKLLTNPGSEYSRLFNCMDESLYKTADIVSFDIDLFLKSAQKAGVTLSNSRIMQDFFMHALETNHSEVINEMLDLGFDPRKAKAPYSTGTSNNTESLYDYWRNGMSSSGKIITLNSILKKRSKMSTLANNSTCITQMPDDDSKILPNTQKQR